MAKCARCQAEIFWVTLSPSGTAIPIDYRSVEDADLAITGNVATKVPEVSRFEYRQEGRRLWPSHLRWCRPERKDVA